MQKAEFAIEGMTCAGCEAHVSTEINKLKGIIEVNVSYEKNKAIVQFDNKKTTIDSITAAINATGYSMTHFKILNNEKE